MDGMLGAGTKAQANDYFRNATARMGFGTPSLGESAEYVLERLSYDYWLMITMYRNHWLSRRIVDTPANDMVKAWPRLTSDLEPKQLTLIDRNIRDTETKQRMLLILQWARLFGGAGALIVIDGHENILDEPLDIESIGIGAYRGLIPFDRWVGIYPSSELATDITRPREFGLPEYYQVGAPNGAERFKVHSSRIIRACGPPVPYPEFQAQMYWGISCLEPCYESIRKLDNMSWNILSVSFRANIIGMKQPQLAQMMSGLNGSQAGLVAFHARMQAMNELLSNQSMVLLEKDGGFEHISQEMSGWSPVLQQFQMDCAGAAEIPVTRLFGRTATGLGQSNDQDERVYEERIAMNQDTELRPQLDKLYPVICMSVLGKVPKDLDLVFPSIRVLDDKEKADLAKASGDNIIGFVGANIINKAMALKELKQSSDVTGFGTNITDEDIEDAEKQVEEEKKLGVAPIGGQGDVPEPGNKKGAAAQAANKAKNEATGAPKDSSKDSEPLERIKFAGLPVAIEVPAGGIRIIFNDEGEVVYERILDYAYGFIEGTVGRDGDEIDVILGPDETAPNVFIIDMIDLGPDVDKREDEDKVFVGFRSSEEAKKVFVKMYREDFFGGMHTAPVAEYRSIIERGADPADVINDFAASRLVGKDSLANRLKQAIDRVFA